MADKKIILLTGEIQTGKTTTLANWVKTRNDVAGILTPVINGRRRFYEISNNVDYAMEAENGEAGILQVGRFLFSEAGFKRAVDYLLSKLPQPQWQYLIVDEIGPLEIRLQKGFWPLLNMLFTNNYVATPVLVVRKSLYTEVSELFASHGYNVQVVDINYF
jgi:nucleoside-triphosphatase THEP1